ncbi:hypothetical protein AB0935_13800, partial [Streptomyces sp. NPDC007027]
DAAAFLVRSMRRMQPELRLDVWFGAPAEFVAALLGSAGPFAYGTGGVPGVRAGRGRTGPGRRDTF